MLIDTHCHLDFPEYSQDRDEVIQRAHDAGVETLINVSSEEKGCKASLALADKYPQIYAALGVHPHYAKDVNEELIARIREMARTGKKIVAIGEVGLDYFRNLSKKEDQLRVFRSFINLSKDLKLPLIIHSRDAAKDTLKVMAEEFDGGVRAVLHCFSAGEKYLEKFLAQGFYISFTANITYPNAERLREVVKACPLEKMMLETDCPYLSPQEHRGNRNEPSYVKLVAEEVARVKGIRVEEVAEVTTKNARKFFDIT